MMTTRHPPIVLVSFSLASLIAPDVGAQTQALAFTGGVLLNTSVQFSNLGAHPTSAVPGSPSGGAIDRTYDNGFNRVDARGNAGGTTVNYGYLESSQIESDAVVLSAGSATGELTVDDAGDFVEPSGNLEYRGSLGGLGKSDWGLLLGVGYQWAGAEESQSYVTDAAMVNDRFALGGLAPAELPPAPYNGSPDGLVPAIGSSPSRTLNTVPRGRTLEGTWALSADLIPITGGLYLESQLAGRLNVVVSAGVLAMLVNAELEFEETSRIGSLPAVTSQASDETTEFIFGGFVQAGLDWALWEETSIVAGARWQPTENFSHSVSGRTMEIDFTGAFAVHAGFSMRF